MNKFSWHAVNEVSIRVIMCLAFNLKVLALEVVAMVMIRLLVHWVIRLLVQLKKNTGENGFLSNHQRLKYHEHAKSAVESFKMTVKKHWKTDIRSQMDRACQQETI